MAFDNLGNYEAKRVQERVGVGDPTDTTPEARAARAAAEAKAKAIQDARAKDPDGVVMAELREEEADQKKIDPAAREKSLKDNVGETVPGSAERSRPAGSIHEARYIAATENAQRVENLINNGYDTLPDPDKVVLRAQIEQALTKYPRLRDGIPPADPARTDYFEHFLRDRDVRAKIREAYVGAITREGATSGEPTTAVEIKRLEDAIKGIDEQILVTQRAIQDAVRRREEAEIDVHRDILTEATTDADRQAQEKIDTAENTLRDKTKAARNTANAQRIAENKLRGFDEPQVNRRGTVTRPGGERWQALERARATLSDPLYSEDAVRMARTTKIQEDDNINRLSQRINELNSKPVEERARDHAAERTYLEGELLRAQRESRNAQLTIDTRTEAKATVDNFESDRIVAQTEADNVVDDARAAERQRAEAERRRDEARGAARPGMEVLEQLDKNLDTLQQQLSKQMNDKAVEQASLGLARLAPAEFSEQAEFIEKFSTIVKDGAGKFIAEALKEAASGDKEFLVTWEKNAKTKIGKAIASFLAYHMSEPGTRGIGVGGGNINIRGHNINIPRIGRERNVLAPNAANIGNYLERFVGNGQIQTETLRETFEDVMAYQEALVAAGQMNAEDALTQAEINEHLADKDARNITIRDLATNLVSARLRLGRMDHLDTANVTNVLNGIAPGETPEEREKWTRETLLGAVEINTHQRDVERTLRAGGVSQREVMDYARRLLDKKNSTGLVTLLALLVGGVVPAGIAWYAMSKRGDGAPAAAPAAAEVKPYTPNF